MQRHFLFVQTSDSGRVLDRRPFQANKLGEPSNEAFANAMRRLPRTDKNVEIDVYVCPDMHERHEENCRYIGKAHWDPCGNVKTVTRA